MGGLISYGRVSEGGPPDFSKTFDFLDGKFDSGDPVFFAGQVRDAVNAYCAFCASHTAGTGSCSSDVVIAVGQGLRDSLASALDRGTLLISSRELLGRAMDAYARVWMSEHTIAQTSLQAEHTAALDGLAAARTAVDDARRAGAPQSVIDVLEANVRRMQETLGMVATRYTLSALCADDIAKVVGGSPISFSGGYREVRGAAGLSYFEGCSGYCVNIMAKMVLPNGIPVVLTGEAKGGSSAIGTAAYNGKRVSQDKREYAVSRAEYMARCSCKDVLVRNAKHEAAEAILDADVRGVLVHLTARMDDGEATIQNVDSA
jgi:hypothetical protein